MGVLRISAAALLVTLAGCASQIMQGYVGEPLQAVMVKRGPPANAFDMGDGRRAFQWIVNDTYVTPTNVYNSGNMSAFGNHANWNQNTVVTGGQPIESECVYTMYGRWSDDRQSWLMEGFEAPGLLCE